MTIFYQEIKKTEPALAEVDESKTLEEKVKNAKVGDVIVLKNIYFKNRSPRIVPESKPTMYELLCVLEDHPNLKIQIQGHICCTPPYQKEAYDMDTMRRELSSNRAEAVYDYLVRKKIDPDRMTFKGYGNRKPLGKEPQYDRRVELVVNKV